MFAAFSDDTYRKNGEHDALKAQGKHEAASRYNDACVTEALSYGRAGRELMTGNIGGALREAKKGIDAMVEQRRIVDENK